MTVPEMAGGRSDEPLDMGELVLKLVPRLNVGDAAPDFELKTLDGKPLKLSEFRGKYVLLDFWATWCGPCLAETPNLKAVYEKYGSDERFVMIGLSSDQDQEAPKKYVEENEIPWPQALLGQQSEVSADYCVRGIPAIFLIGPEGKVVAKGLRGAAIGSELEKVLGR